MIDEHKKLQYPIKKGIINFDFMVISVQKYIGYKSQFKPRPLCILNES